MAAQPHTQLCPLIEVPLSCDGSSDALFLADGPVLLECPGSFDRRLVDACASEDLVLAFLRGEGALRRPRLVGCQVGVRLDDVVLDERVASPAVDSKVSGASGVIGTGVLDSSLFRVTGEQSSTLAEYSRTYRLPP